MTWGNLYVNQEKITNWQWEMQVSSSLENLKAVWRANNWDLSIEMVTEVI